MKNDPPRGFVMSVADKIASLKASLPSGVTLVAVSKTYPPSAIMEAYEAGQRVFRGKNRPQELAAKQAELPGDIEWHLIGGLQTNKVKLVAPFVSMIHSAESPACFGSSTGRLVATIG